ncbi:MAG: hypothetical protein ACRDL7_07490, partial [Gaiellaceae bacterium]
MEGFTDTFHPLFLPNEDDEAAVYSGEEEVNVAVGAMFDNEESDDSDDDDDDDLPVFGSNDWRMLKISPTDEFEVKVDASSDRLQKLLVTEMETLYSMTSTKLKHKFGNKQRSDSYNESDIVSILIETFLPETFIELLKDAANQGLNNGDSVDMNDIKSFIKVICWLSFYGTSPECFFDKTLEIDYSAAKDLSYKVFKDVLRGLSGVGAPGNEWGFPFDEDKHMREAEAIMSRISSGFAFVKGESILSIDDDQYRLSSPLVESMLGVSRIRNPKKAFGPVSTGAVSLTTGITLATRLKGKLESTVINLQILLQKVFKQDHFSTINGAAT